MTIEVGHILDKYELIEKVGQGGMAVVYRALDTSLQRQVAIKVLHGHLADHREARDRFEREAQAVAKLRHENILEIFDFSGTDSSESYIVTEFIDGQTLRQFLNHHEIEFPEVGALVTLQICRALSHAHGFGILHRDVKPENIMIRSDGVVKLTDFGIAQMVDLQRMTVTGQLLGSPAYMSPEHVQGKPLDFRTDVFSAGILLYLLVTGELPFQGRNPHEILKRIADGNYTDARARNPRVGKELARILNRSLATEPDDRYPDISEMQSALQSFVSGSGLGNQSQELAQFFDAPGSFELAFRARLTDTLTRRANEAMDAGTATTRLQALELYNRVLTIDPNNTTVLKQIATLSRRKRTSQIALVCGATIIVVGLALVGYQHIGSATENASPTAVATLPADAQRESDAAIIGPVDAPPHDAPAKDALVLASPVDAGLPDARLRRAVRPPPRQKPSQQPDARAATVAKQRVFRLRVFPRTATFRVDGGPAQSVANHATLRVKGNAKHIQFFHPQCQPLTVRLPAHGGTIAKTLGWLPARVVPRCSHSDVAVQINGRSARLGRRETILITNSRGVANVTVTFSSPRLGSNTQKIVVQAKANQVVTCAF